jgi:hypothetical protein
MDKSEKEAYNKKIKLYEKLGAEKFQDVVLEVEKIKFKVLKTICPNFLKYYEKFADHKKKKELKKATTEEQKEEIRKRYQFAKMAMRAEFYQEKNRNYHINLDRPSEMVKYLEWNKSVHKRGLIKDAILIPILIGCTTFSVPGALPLLIFELISAGINFECVNIQNYNLCRIERIPHLKEREQKKIRREMEEHGEGAKAIYDALEKHEDVPTIEGVIAEIDDSEKLRQLREILLREQRKRAIEKEVLNKGGKLK